jgi:hypothetical protein
MIPIPWVDEDRKDIIKGPINGFFYDSSTFQGDHGFTSEASGDQSNFLLHVEKFTLRNSLFSVYAPKV